ncbi:MAG: hypothetical protein KatS3mg110_0301 [Pirellulaceae bacterium]|nr:MAG: hypothetical protein KatS3mg110_0301 [Pirellulaceae bacterium]
MVRYPCLGLFRSRRAWPSRRCRLLLAQSGHEFFIRPNMQYHTLPLFQRVSINGRAPQIQPVHHASVASLPALRAPLRPFDHIEVVELGPIGTKCPQHFPKWSHGPRYDRLIRPLGTLQYLFGSFGIHRTVQTQFLTDFLKNPGLFANAFTQLHAHIGPQNLHHYARNAITRSEIEHAATGRQELGKLLRVQHIARHEQFHGRVARQVDLFVPIPHDLPKTV